jgi:hypothetical protein
MDAIKSTSALETVVAHNLLVIICSIGISLKDFESFDYLLIQVVYRLDFPINL